MTSNTLVCTRVCVTSTPVGAWTVPKGPLSAGGRNLASGKFSTVPGGYANEALNGWATVAGGGENTATATHATVGGGYANRASGTGAFVGGGTTNRIFASYGTIGGGANNWVATVGGGDYATIGGGTDNGSYASYGTIGGGGGNRIGSSAWWGTIGGGGTNYIAANAHYSTVGGGHANTIALDSELATISGGESNLAAGTYAVVGGGWWNQAGGYTATVSGGATNTASDHWATVGGGWGNTAAGRAATVPGGYNNLASGWYSFVAGRRAKADGQGSFVWGDASDCDVHAWGNNQFVVRATGGYWLFSAVDGTGAPTAGVTLAAGSGTWGSWCDRNAKTNCAPVDARTVLDKVVALPIATWNYKTQDPAIRHLGPMAQDFHAAFGVGDSDKTITTVDADGVALAAIQGLNQKVETAVKDKDARIAELERRLAALERLLKASTQ